MTNELKVGHRNELNKIREHFGMSYSEKKVLFAISKAICLGGTSFELGKSNIALVNEISYQKTFSMYTNTEIGGKCVLCGYFNNITEVSCHINILYHSPSADKYFVKY